MKRNSMKKLKTLNGWYQVTNDDGETYALELKSHQVQVLFDLMHALPIQEVDYIQTGHLGRLNAIRNPEITAACEACGNCFPVNEMEDFEGDAFCPECYGIVTSADSPHQADKL